MTTKNETTTLNTTTATIPLNYLDLKDRNGSSTKQPNETTGNTGNTSINNFHIYNISDMVLPVAILGGFIIIVRVLYMLESCRRKGTLPFLCLVYRFLNS